MGTEGQQKIYDDVQSFLKSRIFKKKKSIGRNQRGANFFTLKNRY